MSKGMPDFLFLTFFFRHPTTSHFALKLLKIKYIHM